MNDYYPDELAYVLTACGYCAPSATDIGADPLVFFGDGGERID